MTYDGKVTPGGPPQTRTTGQLEITKLSVGPLDNNAYLLRCRTTGHALLIDAANEPDRLLELCGGSLDAIATTHGHRDHWLGLQEVVAATGATTYAHQADVPMIGVVTDQPLHAGGAITVGAVELEVVHLVGHTAGSAAIIHRDSDGSVHCWSGDCLFPDGVGKTWGEPELFELLLDQVTSKLFDQLPDETWVYPGHGNDTTIGVERPQLGQWRARGW